MLGDKGELTDAGPVLVVTDDAAAAAVIARVVAASPRLRALAIGWTGAEARIAEQARLAAVVADCAGFDAATLAGTLPELARACQLAPAGLVVGFDALQLDVVAAELLGSEATLLCEPNAIDWAAALALAVRTGGTTLHDPSSEQDRYDRLSREVARIAETLAGLAEPEAAQQQQQGKGEGFVGEPPRGYGARTGEIDPAEVRRAIRARRLRDEAFAQGGLFEDPAWDMLLDLFAAELERRPVSVSSLCIAAAVAAVPATTALRWISKLIAAGLLERRPDSHDRRRAFITLTAEASRAMRVYVTSLRKAGLRLG